MLRLSYNNKKRNNIKHNNLTWISFDGSNIESVSNNNGRFYKRGNTATINFYLDKEKTKPLCAVRINIEWKKHILKLKF